MEPLLPTTAVQDAAPGLDAVRRRRAELRETLTALEFILAAPAPGRAEVWGAAVHAQLVLVGDDLGAHIEVTEGPDGLHQAILAADLRLANAVQALTVEHGEIADTLARLIIDSETPVGAADVDAVRERATRLMGQIARHRQRGADLIYEAYQTDIGGAG